MTPQPHEDVIAPNIGALLNPAHICIVGAREGDGIEKFLAKEYRPGFEPAPQ